MKNIRIILLILTVVAVGLLSPTVSLPTFVKTNGVLLLALCVLVWIFLEIWNHNPTFQLSVLSAAKSGALGRFVLVVLAGLVIVALVSGIALFTIQHVTSTGSATVHQVAPTANISEFSLPRTVSPWPPASYGPGEITAGLDGNLWFTEYNGNAIGRITLVARLLNFLSQHSVVVLVGLQQRPDGNLWFTEGYGKKIGRMIQWHGPQHFSIIWLSCKLTCIGSVNSMQHTPPYEEWKNRDYQQPREKTLVGGIDACHRQVKLFREGGFQDRLVSELRLEGASTLEEANGVLQTFLPRFNARFAVPAAETLLAWQAVPEGLSLDECFCLHEECTVALDNTISYHGSRGRSYLPTEQRRSFARAKVCVHEHFDGQIAIFWQGQAVPSRLAPADLAQLTPQSASPPADAPTSPLPANGGTTSPPGETTAPSSLQARKPKAGIGGSLLTFLPSSSPDSAKGKNLVLQVYKIITLAALCDYHGSHPIWGFQAG